MRPVWMFEIDHNNVLKTFTSARMKNKTKCFVNPLDNDQMLHLNLRGVAALPCARCLKRVFSPNSQRQNNPKETFLICFVHSPTVFQPYAYREIRTGQAKKERGEINEVAQSLSLAKVRYAQVIVVSRVGGIFLRWSVPEEERDKRVCAFGCFRLRARMSYDGSSAKSYIRHATEKVSTLACPFLTHRRIFHRLWRGNSVPTKISPFQFFV